jgi:hypothetical protein
MPVSASSPADTHSPDSIQLLGSTTTPIPAATDPNGQASVAPSATPVPMPPAEGPLVSMSTLAESAPPMASESLKGGKKHGHPATDIDAPGFQPMKGSSK